MSTILGNVRVINLAAVNPLGLPIHTGDINDSAKAQVKAAWYRFGVVINSDPKAMHRAFSTSTRLTSSPVPMCSGCGVKFAEIMFSGKNQWL
nr:hypothetical protein [Aeromonas salmonicida]